MKTKRKSETTDRRSISHQLRRAIEDDGRTAYALGQEAEVDAGIIQRFLNGERSLSLATVDRLSIALGLRLVEGSRGRGRPTKAGRETPRKLDPADDLDTPLGQTVEPHSVDLALSQMAEPPLLPVKVYLDESILDGPERIDHVLVGQVAESSGSVEIPDPRLFGDSKLSGPPEPEQTSPAFGPTGFLALFGRSQGVEGVTKS